MDKTASQAEMLANRLVKRDRHLRKWAGRAGTNAYRLYDRDIPEIPLLIERWDRAVTVSLYKRPYDKDPGEESLWLEAMLAALSSALSVPRELIFPRTRERKRGSDQRPKTGAPPPYPGGGFGGRRPPSSTLNQSRLTVTEGGLLYRVSLSGYIDTGLYLDRRRLRLLVKEEAAGKRLLNLFAYTCAFSLCAAAGGAALADSIDLSQVYLDWGRSNFALNGLDPGRYAFIKSDVPAFLSKAAREKRRWDMIVLDPPAYSNSRSAPADFDLRKDHAAMISRCLGLLAPGGVLYFSAQPRTFVLDRETLASLRPAPNVEDLTESLRDEDFPSRRIPRCYRLTLP